MRPNHISYCPILLAVVVIGGCGSSSNPNSNRKGCWWSFCQSQSLSRRGCQPQHLYYEVQSVPCNGSGKSGNMYQCCPIPATKNGNIQITDYATSTSTDSSNDIDTSAEESGICSWYGFGDVAQGSPTASGEPFDRYTMNAAHKTLPFGTRIRVMNSNTLKTVDVVINDRGPFIRGRILDLTYAAFGVVENRDKGLFRCSYTILF